MKNSSKDKEDDEDDRTGFHQLPLRLVARRPADVLCLQNPIRGLVKMFLPHSGGAAAEFQTGGGSLRSFSMTFLL